MWWIVQRTLTVVLPPGPIAVTVVVALVLPGPPAQLSGNGYCPLSGNGAPVSYGDADASGTSPMAMATEVAPYVVHVIDAWTAGCVSTEPMQCTSIAPFTTLPTPLAVTMGLAIVVGAAVTGVVTGGVETTGPPPGGAVVTGGAVVGAAVGPAPGAVVVASPTMVDASRVVLSGVDPAGPEAGTVDPGAVPADAGARVPVGDATVVGVAVVPTSFPLPPQAAATSSTAPTRVDVMVRRNDVTR
jgi:hypothetical protein